MHTLTDCPSLCLESSFQEYGTLGSVQAESEYERQMMSVFNRVLEEVESLTKKHPPVSYLVRLTCNTWWSPSLRRHVIYADNLAAGRPGLQNTILLMKYNKMMCLLLYLSSSLEVHKSLTLSLLKICWLLFFSIPAVSAMPS